MLWYSQEAWGTEVKSKSKLRKVGHNPLAQGQGQGHDLEDQGVGHP